MSDHEDRRHVESADCWCKPTVEYVPPLVSYGQADNSLLARARRASTDAQKLALYFELVAALAAHERELIELNGWRADE